MLRQDKLAFVKAISTLQVSPALLKELRLSMARRKKKPAVPAGKHTTISGSGIRASQQLAGKCKANELACSGDLMEPSNRRPTPGAFCVSAHELISHGRRSCCRQPATRTIHGRGDVRGCTRRARHLVSAKWAAQAHRHGFGPVRIRCLIRDNQQAHV